MQSSDVIKVKYTLIQQQTEYGKKGVKRKQASALEDTDRQCRRHRERPGEEQRECVRVGTHRPGVEVREQMQVKKENRTSNWALRG